MPTLDHPELLAYIASAIGVAVVLPQLRRIARSPALGGVSAWTWALTVVACSLWMTYGVRTGSMPQIPGNILLVAGAAAVVLLVPAAWSPRLRAVALTSATAAGVLVSAWLPPAAVGFLALGIGLVGTWPQVVQTVWLRRGMGPSAVSLTSMGLKVLSQGLWLSFALMTADVPVMIAALLILTTSVLVMLVERSRRPDDADEAASWGPVGTGRDDWEAPAIACPGNPHVRP